MTIFRTALALRILAAASALVSASAYADYPLLADDAEVLEEGRCEAQWGVAPTRALEMPTATSQDATVECGIGRNTHDIPSWTTTDYMPTDTETGPRILCVAHGGTNAVVTAALLGANRVPFEWFRFWYGHTTIGRLTARATSGIIYFALQSLETPHLPKDLRTA